MTKNPAFASMISSLASELGALQKADAKKRATKGKTLTFAEQERVKKSIAKKGA